MTNDDWNIKRLSNKELIELLQNPLTCREVEIVASKEALARILNLLIEIKGI